MKNSKSTSSNFFILVLVFSFLTLWTNALFAQLQAHDPGRGLYIDGFATSLDSRNLVPAFSILGETAKEDSLIKFAQENHITYFILYNLSAVFQGDNNKTRLDTILCEFILKAKNAGIKKIGAAIGGTRSLALVQDYQLRQMQPTPAWTFSIAEKAQPSYSSLQFVENTYSASNSLFELAEITKQALLAAKFNRVAPTCDTNARFDFINLEYEFWNKNSINTNDTTANTLYKLYKKAQEILDAMTAVRQMNNALHAPIETEQYLGYLDNFPELDSLTIAKYLDGDSLSTGVLTPDSERLVNRFLLAYYNTDPNSSYNRSNYLNRYHTFDNAATLDSTATTPLFSAATKDLGYGEDHYGVWFRKSNRNNLFVAEKIWYTSKLTDSNQPSNSAQRNVSEPGGAVWYTSSIMTYDNTYPTRLKHTNTFYSDSPVNTYGNDSGTVSFTYAGPLEKDIAMQLIIKDSLGNTKYTKIDTTRNSSTAITLPNIGAKLLPNGSYTASLALNYGNGITYTYSEKVSIGNGVRLQAMGNTTICDGGGVIIKSGKTASSGTFIYKWFCNNKYYGTDTTVAFIYAKKAGYYKCKIENSSGTLLGITDSIFVTVLANPIAHILEQNISGVGATRTLVATPLDSNASYAWKSGETQASINISSTQYDDFEVTITQANGCKRSASVSITKVSCDTLDLALSSNKYSSNIDNSTLAANLILPLSGNFHFNSNFNLSGKTIYVLPSTKLTVDSSYILTLTNQTQIKGCSKMWKGIQIAKNAVLDCDSNVVIEDAVYGVHAVNGSNYFISNTNFNRNYVGLFVEGFSHQTIGIGKYAGLFSFIRSSHFDGASNFLAADSALIYPLGTKPMCGILANAAKVFINLNDSLHTSSFKNLSNGIIARNNSYVVEHYSEFKNIHADSAYSNQVTHGNGSAFLASNNSATYVPRVIGNKNDSLANIVNCDFGVYSLNSSIDVFYNKMDSVNNGVKIHGINPLQSHRGLINLNTINASSKGVSITDANLSHATLVLNNEIKIGYLNGPSNKTGIDINLGTITQDTSLKIINNVIYCSNAEYGIKSNYASKAIFKGNSVFFDANLTLKRTGVDLNSCTECLVENNLVKGDYDTTKTNQLLSGFRSSLSNGLIFSCNQADSTAFGFKIAGVNNNSTFRANGMHSNKFGLYLDTSGTIGIQNHQGNLFNGNFKSWAAINYNQLQLLSSEFDIYGDTLKQYYPIGKINPASGWFFPDADSNEYQCQLTSIYIPYVLNSAGIIWIGGEPVAVDDYQNMRRIINDSLLSAEYPEEVQEIAEDELLQRLRAHPEFLADPELNSFYLLETETALGQQNNLRHLQEDFPSEVVQARNNLSSAEYYILQTQLAIEQLSNLLGTEFETEFVHEQLEQLNINLSQQEELYNQLYDACVLAYEEHFHNLQELNLQVDVSSLMQENEQIVNTIAFETIGQGIYTFNNAQIQLLESIVFQCPKAGGKAVYRARAFYSLVNDTIVYNDDATCAQQGFYRKKKEEIAKKAATNFNFTVTPNPSKDFFTISSVPENSEISIFNAQGLKVFTKIIDSENQNLVINTASFSNGVYFISIQNANGIKTRKITILH